MSKSTFGLSARSVGILSLLLSSIFWGAGPVFTKLGISEIPPFTFGFLRLALALILVLPFFFLMEHHRIKRADVKQFILMGLFGSGLSAVFFMSGLSRTTASTASAIFATVPLVNAVAASLILREIPSKVRILGVIIGFLGSFIITTGPELISLTGMGNIWGNLLILGAVITWVAYIISSKELLDKYSPLTVTTYSFLIGAVILLPLSYFEIFTYPGWYLNLTWHGIMAIIYSAVFAGLLAFMFFQWGMKQTSAFEAGIITYLQPVLTALIAIPVLGEFPQPIFILGTAFIIGGVFLATVYELIKKKKEK